MCFVFTFACLGMFQTIISMKMPILGHFVDQHTSIQKKPKPMHDIIITQHQQHC